MQYTYVREVREFDRDSGHVWVVKAEGRGFPSHGPRPGVVRVNEYKQSAALTDDGKGGTKGRVTQCIVPCKRQLLETRGCMHKAVLT